MAAPGATGVWSAKVPHGRWRTLTFLAALRHDRIDAPCVIDNPINGASLLADVEQVLLPTPAPGDIVVMDNLAAESGKRSAAGSKPPGQAALPAALFARPAGLRQTQTLLRKADERTHATLAAHRLAARLLHQAECADYLKNAGYASS